MNRHYRYYYETPKKDLTEPKPKRKKAKPLIVATVLLLLAAVAVAVWYFKFYDASTQSAAIKPPTHIANENQSSSAQFALPAGNPQRLVIDSVDIDDDMEPVHLPSSGVLIPPFGVAAWYAEGPKPGFPGPAVIVGHVDSTKGPNVFWNLHKVETGDKVIVYYLDRKLTFVVTKTATSPYNKLPTDKIWNKTNEQVLRVITCIGTFNYQTRRYSDNFIVYAKEIASQPLPE